MTAIDAGRTTTLTARPRTKGQILVSYITTTDHKVIGNLYLITSFMFFLAAGLMAMVMRAELARPGLQVVDDEVYNQLFTMHGTIMLLLFATPLFVGFANAIMPLQIGAPDVAFPRLNMFSYWLFLFGGLIVLSGFIVPGGAADFGWFAYAPLNDAVRSPGIGGDLWIMGLWMAGLGTILGGVNFVTTILCMRAPGMTMFRMPIFTWNILITSLLVLIAFPILAGALLALEADRLLGAHIFDAANGGPILWQHLFWFFGHPEVYIIALPFFGIITEILPVFSRKPIFGYVGLVGATLSIAALSVAVWAHHMFVTGAVDLPFFSFMTFLIAVPTGVKFFNWIGTMWGGSVSMDTPMLWAVGFLTTFLFGGLTGIILASPPLDFQLSDSYFVVAHFHYVVFGTVVFAMFGGFYYWWPKLTGRMLDERLGKIHFWLLFIGFHMTFLVQHWLGVEGMPRRYADYKPTDGFTGLNELSSIGAFLLGASTIPFLYNVWKSRTSPLVHSDDPWGWGRSLEWATSSPPPRHNFDQLPRIRSESPAFDLHHPEVALMELENNVRLNQNGQLADTAEVTRRTEHLDEQAHGAPPQGRDPHPTIQDEEEDGR
jgi:cytochrome c oxidase subunit I